MSEILKPKKKRSRAPLIVIALILIMIGTAALTWALYDQEYEIRRETDPNRNVYLLPDELKDIDNVEHKFKNNRGDELAGRYYTLKGSNAPQALIVFAHSFGAGHYPNLAEIRELVKANFAVFAYDATGTGKSGGEDIVGFPQAVYDLRAALDYVKTQPDMARLKLGLYGHGWGGYAVTAILNEDYPIKAVVDIAGPYSSRAFFIEDSKKSVSTLAYSFFPFITFVEKEKFDIVSSYSGIDGINGKGIPVLSMHSKDDKQSPYAAGLPKKESKITNTKVVFKTFEDRGHDLILSDDARAYQTEVLNGMIEILKAHDGWPPAELMKEYTDKVDRERLNTADPALMHEIINFYTYNICNT